MSRDRMDEDRAYLGRPKYRVPEIPAPTATRSLPTVAELLEFERQYAGNPARENLARTWWAWKPARLEQELQRALATPAALEHDAELTHRLTRLREARTAARANRTPIRHNPN